MRFHHPHLPEGLAVTAWVGAMYLAITSDIPAALLVGLGALLAGVGSVLSGIAALKGAKQRGREEALNEMGVSSGSD